MEEHTQGVCLDRLVILDGTYDCRLHICMHRSLSPQINRWHWMSMMSWLEEKMRESQCTLCVGCMQIDGTGDRRRGGIKHNNCAD